jgi:ferredoxin
VVRIFYHRIKCIGCNGCVEAAPDRWRVSKKDGRCNLIGGKEKKGIYHATVSFDELEANQKAAENCPVKVIRVEVF